MNLSASERVHTIASQQKQLQAQQPGGTEKLTGEKLAGENVHRK